MLDQGMLDLPLLRLSGQAKKVETVRVFQRLAGKIGLRLGQARGRIRDHRAAAFQQAGFDVQVQHIAWPAMRDGAPRIGQALLGAFPLGEQHQVMPPQQLSNSLLDNFSIRPRLGKRAHIRQVRA